MNKQKPTKRTGSSDPTKSSVYDHPAFGVIRVNNCHGGRMTLLGSDLKHDDYIVVEIAPAEMHRSYGENLVFGSRKPIMKFAMTHAQFTALGQSIGNGQGTPVTIQYAPSSLNHDVIALPSIEPLDSSLTMSKDELDQTLHKQVNLALKTLAEVTEAVKAKKSGKVLLELISSAENQIALLPSNLSSGLEFAKEVLDKTGQEVQANAEAAIQLRLKSLGIKSLGGDQNQLLQIDKTQTDDTNLT
jgi:hypothetical protein